MPGISYNLDLDATSFRQGASQGMDYINQLHQRIDKLKSAGGGGGGNGFLAGLSQTLFQLPQQVMALAGILSTLQVPSKLAASAETTSVAFRTLVGNATIAENTIARIRELAAKTPFEFPELADAARKLVAFGESADTIPDTLRRIGDIAAGTGVSVSELAEIYGKARVAGTLFSEDIDQMTGRGIPAIQEFAKILGVAESEVKQLASEGKIGFADLEQAFINLTAQGGQFAGMMEELSATMEGKLSNLGDSAKNLLTKVGTGLNEGLKPLVDGLIEKTDSLSATAVRVGQSIQDAFDMGAVAAESGQIVELMTALWRTVGLTIANEMAKGASAGMELVKRGLYETVMNLDMWVAEQFGDEEYVRKHEEAQSRRGEHAFEGVFSETGPLDDRIAFHEYESKKTFEKFQNKVTGRKADRSLAALDKEADKKNAAETDRIEAERTRFIDYEQAKKDRKVQLDTLANAKEAGYTPDQITGMKADFIASAQQAAGEKGLPTAELNQMRADFGMKPVMDETAVAARLKNHQKTLQDAKFAGRTPAELAKMKSEFVANARKEGMDGDSLDKMRKAFGMDDTGTKTKPGSLGSGTGGGADGAPAGQPLPLPGNAGRDFRARENERERVSGGGSGQGGSRRIQSRSMAESIRAGFARQAGTGSGAVNWSTYVGRQIGLTNAQRSSLLRGGPDAQSLGSMTGRGQSRRAASAKAAAEETAKAGGQKEKADLDRLVRQMAKDVETIAKSVKEGGKL